MKKILSSLIVITAVIASSILAVRAYFSDTETSTGNTISAGTIDISVDEQNPWNKSYTSQWADMKPGHTRDMEFTVANVGENPLVLWKRIHIVERSGGTTSEPECSAQGGSWEEGVCTGGTEVDDLDSVIHYSMTSGGTTVVNPSWNVMMKDIAELWMPVGNLAPGANLTIHQDYKMDETAGNEYQGDAISFNIDLYAEQYMGTGPEHTTRGVILENKSLDPDWLPVIDATWGILTWDGSGNYNFRGWGLNNSLTYQIAYWNGSSEVAVSSTGTPSSGELTLSGIYGAFSTNTNAKYWLRPVPWSSSSDANTLWESNLVN